MSQNSLWGDEFIIPPKDNTNKILDKINNPKKVKTTTNVLKSKAVSIDQKLSIIGSEVKRILGKYQEDTKVIYSLDELKDYVDEAIKKDILSIDTETNNSLDPLTCTLMGVCAYVPGMKQAYIPLNHVDKNRVRLENQLTEEDITREFNRLKNTKVIFSNAKFDYKVLFCTCGLKMRIDWDTQVCAKVLDENERAGLKQQYIDKIDPSIEKYSINHLFDIEYAVVPPELFALYAATDAYMTYKLYEWQKTQLEKPENKNLYSLYKEIELPLVEVVAHMELTGVCIDQEYAKRLSAKYQKLYEGIMSKVDNELLKYTNQINAWRQTPDANEKKLNSKKTGYSKSKSEQLETPIKISSPTQLSILLYDVLKVEPVDKKKPRGTGEEILTKINLPICDLILELRGISKLINTYIEKLPLCVSEKDERLHADFNQYGADTGRFSSSDPNLQNIPARNKEIRLLFKATNRYKLIGADYSAQEPRLLAAYSQDDNMIKNYDEGKDLYSSVASSVYKNRYEDNREFHSDGTPNPEGKKRRNNCKSLILGLMYGRGISSIAEQIKDHSGKVTHKDIKQAQDITNTFFSNYPKAEKWIEETKTNLYKNGYVEDLWGRRRRLPDIFLEPYEINFMNKNIDFNPLLNTKGVNNEINKDILEQYRNQLSKVTGRKQVEKIIFEAGTNGVRIKNNNGFIAQAERQGVNARIQGGAASMSKKAMINIHHDKELKELGFRLLIAVHDELIGEAPEKNIEKASKRFSYLMEQAAKPTCIVPMKCDTVIESSWYENDYNDSIKSSIENLIRDNYSRKDIIEYLENEHSELAQEKVKEIIQQFDFQNPAL